MSSSYIQIGAGKIYVNPTAGNLATNPTPKKLVTVQDFELDIAGTIEELKGNQQFPDDTAVTEKKGSGKFTIGRKDLGLLNQIFFADVQATGGTSVAADESHSIPGVSTYTITVTPPSSGAFAEDLGVVYGADISHQFDRVASSPAVGQYTVSAGVYTFASADASAAVLISYAYTLTAGFTYQMNNQTIGWGPQVEMFVVETYQPLIATGVFNVIRVYACKINKVMLGNKRDKYSNPQVDFAYFAGANGRVLDMYVNK